MNFKFMETIKFNTNSLKVLNLYFSRHFQTEGVCKFNSSNKTCGYSATKPVLCAPYFSQVKDADTPYWAECKFRYYLIHEM